MEYYVQLEFQDLVDPAEVDRRLAPLGGETLACYDVYEWRVVVRRSVTTDAAAIKSCLDGLCDRADVGIHVFSPAEATGSPVEVVRDVQVGTGRVIGNRPLVLKRGFTGEVVAVSSDNPDAVMVVVDGVYCSALLFPGSCIQRLPPLVALACEAE